MSIAQKEANMVVLMGPAGAGKSTLGAALARQTGWPFLEGDDYHPFTNKEKQAAGLPLTDMDRVGWIDAIVQGVNANPAAQLLLACSALTPYVQRRLRTEIHRHIRWILLLPSHEELQKRLETRPGHFMPASLLKDQLAALTPPAEAICLDAAPINDLCEQVLATLA